MCKMPFYKMYPADAETDANFRLMDFAERGFYWSCLNMSWINGGLPADPEDRARLLSAPRDLADRYWVRVGRCFVASPDGLTMVNPRQELERADALQKSQQSSEAARKKWESVRNADAYAVADASAMPRASESDSVSDSSSVFVSSSTESTEQQITVRRAREVSSRLDINWETDEQYQTFTAKARAFWKDLVDGDLIHWYRDWKILYLPQKLLVNERLQDRIDNGQDFRKVYKYTYFTKGEWERPQIQSNVPIPFPVRETNTERSIRVAHEQIRKYGRL